MKIVYLKPKGSFRTDLRSDTLWGTICWAIWNVYGNSGLELFLQSYLNRTPEFIISSAFPFVEIGTEKIPFFPKPLVPVDKYVTNNSNKLDDSEKLKKQEKEFSRIKDLKKISYFSISDFERLINNEIKIGALLNEVLDKKDDNLAVPKTISETVTHNTIDRLKGGTLSINDEGQLFHIEEKYLSTENSGLFFLVKGEKLEKLYGALRFLKHIGIGGDRNTGKGFFDFEMQEADFELKEPEDFNAVTNLSLYYPNQGSNELETFKNVPDFFNYQLEDRQGKIGFLKYNKFDKYATTMFKEGSIFPVNSANTHKIFGVNRDVRPDENKNEVPHSIYQYGFGFMIKLKIAEL